MITTTTADIAPAVKIAKKDETLYHMHNNGKLSIQQYKVLDKNKDSMAVYNEHVQSAGKEDPKTGKRVGNARRCAVCKLNCYTKCFECGLYLHFKESKDSLGHLKNCFFQFHSRDYCGLTFEDRKLVGIDDKDWKPWTNKQLEENKKHIQSLEKQMRRR